MAVPFGVITYFIDEREFNVDSGRGVYFANPTDVTNIFTRVTGVNSSNINGTLGVLGSANLLFLNPNGIVFGADAKLDVKGSFLGTTASNINFADGTKFSTIISEATPLLTVSVPVGLGFGTGEAAIVNQATPGLNVLPGQTLALVGGAISFDQGKVMAPDGRIELGSVGANSSVGITSTQPGWTLNYGGVTSFRDINMRRAASADVSGSAGGSIQVQGRQLILREGSNIVSRTQGTGTGGLINVYASDLIEITGSGTDVTAPSGIYSTVIDGASGRGSDVMVETNNLRIFDGLTITAETTNKTTSTVNAVTLGTGIGGNLTVKANQVEVAEQATLFTTSGIWKQNVDTGNAGNLTVEANSVIVRDGGLLTATTEGDGNAGNLNITAKEIQIIATPENPTTVIESTSYGRGKAGNITIDTEQLQILDGGRLASSSDEFGDAGNINIRAESVTLAGETSAPPDEFSWFGWYRNAISAYTISPGNAGNISLDVKQLHLQDGSAIRAGTFGSGNSGNITVRASEITLTGTNASGADYSGFITAALDGSTGNAGNITVDAKQLRILNGAQISTVTNSSGKAGDISITSNLVEVAGKSAFQSPSRIAAASIPTQNSNTGTAGSVNINTRDLIVRDQAEVSVSSLGSGNSGNLNIQANSIQLNRGANLKGDVNVGSQGNINIDTQTLIMLGASNITTNASEDANGGNITINAAAIAQLENSNITANAVKGSGGNIQITTQGLFKSEDSNIIAASERGISGTTNITTQKIRQDNSLQKQASNFIDTNQAIATSCLARNNAIQGRFVVTGSGGLPNTPSNHVDLDYSILSVSPVNITAAKNIQNTQVTWKLGDKIQEATQLVTTSSGRLLLSTNANTIPKTQTLIC
ncbi:hypothetical protein NIES4071_81050 [Calothrix sp. NIES-4071]|nr:hypothetical protein NIES4071_81050 [Calothrix sp. NIES-4071]BAZ62375.1 hypothetical protein NIES4105_80980 [Calothrix sp. NIES-4105]